MTKDSTYPKVAVVILTWNGKHFLEEFLPLLVKHTHYPNSDFIIADNQSTDGTVPFVRKHFPLIKIISNSGNIGFAAGYNEALSKISAPYYVLLNQDVEVSPFWLTPLMDTIKTNENIAVCQPKIRAQKNKHYFEYAGAAGGYIDHLGYPFCRGRIFESVEIDKGQYEQSIPIFWGSGACMLIRAKTYQRLKGFDKDFFAHMEEIDLCWRVQQINQKIIYVPRSTIYHVGGGSLPQGNPLKIYLNFRNSLYMLFKNLPTPSLPLGILSRLILDGIAGIQALLDGRPTHTWAIIKAHWMFFVHIPKLISKRKEIKHKKSFSKIDGVYKGSIVWQHFIKKVATFDALK